MLSVAGAVAGKLAQGGLAFFNLLALLFLTPVVTFYLLRDWERLVDAIDGAFAARPRRHDPQARPRDPTPPSRVTCVGRPWSASRSAAIYAIGLSLVGLKFGLVIGLIAGAISFIPSSAPSSAR